MSACLFTYPDGNPCRSHAQRGYEFCANHKGTAEPTERRGDGATGREDQNMDEPVVGRSRSPRRPVAPSPRPVDPALVASAMQQMLLHQEVDDRLRRSRSRAKARDGEGYELPEPASAIPIRVVPRRRSNDSTLPVGRDGKQLAQLRSDWVQRWVRERDHLDRPTQARVAEFDEYGWEVVKENGADGEPVRSRFGVLMQGPPEQAALRSAEKTPKGAVQRDEALLMAMDMAEAANRMADADVARVVVDNEHRSVRTLEGSGVELLRE